MAPHPLDRPVWSALTTGWSALSQGDGLALRIHPDYGLFAAARDGSAQSLAALTALVPEEGEIGLVEAGAAPDLPGITATPAPLIWQMVCEGLTPAPPSDVEIAPLTDADAAQMLALATLTRPGPFFSRTHQLGGFVGVKDADGRLLAMAGERMRMPGFTEVSGVCTLLECRGRGYAGALIRVVAGPILARGETAFLHSYAANTGAVALYEGLGFVKRAEMTFTMLGRS